MQTTQTSSVIVPIPREHLDMLQHFLLKLIPNSSTTPMPAHLSNGIVPRLDKTAQYHSYVPISSNCPIRWVDEHAPSQKRRTASRKRVSLPREDCEFCHTSLAGSVEVRRGPSGMKYTLLSCGRMLTSIKYHIGLNSLCNSCGIKYSRMLRKRMCQESHPTVKSAKMDVKFLLG